MVAWIITLVTLGVLFTILTSESRVLGLIILGILIVATISAIVDFAHKGK
jgi:hypothetical protein